MKHEKIIKREDGSKVNISVTLQIGSFDNTFTYNLHVSICEPKKRTFHYVNDTDNFTWRRMNHIERKQYEYNLFLKYASPEELLAAKLELWELLKPLN